MDSDTRPGRRGRHPRCSRESSRSAGGLRLFSLKVVEKIRSRVRTTYNAVANELVSDQNGSGGNARDGKSIRRRCYDAINVLLACGLIKKDDKKQIVWRGHGNVEVDRLRAEIEKKAQEVEQKKKLLQDMERKHKTLQALLALGVNRELSEAQDSGCGGGGGSLSARCRSSEEGQRYTIPFMLVQAPAGAQVHLHTSDDKTTIQFELTDAPPQLHDDCSVVMLLKQYEAERLANQHCRKEHPRGVGPSQGTDSGQPTPVQQAAADPLPCDLPTPEAVGQQPTPVPQLLLPQQEQPHCGVQQPQQQLQPQRQPLQEVDPQALELETLEQLQPSPPSPPRPHPRHQLGQRTAGQLCRPLFLQQQQQQQSARPQQQREWRLEADFLAHLKPVVTNRSRIWPRLQPPVLPPLGPQAAAQAQAAEPLAVQTRAAAAAAAAGPSWQAAALQPPPQLPPAAALSLPPPPPPPPHADLSFSPGGGLSPFLCARSLEQQLQPPQQQQPCTPFSARLSACFQHLGSDPLQTPLGRNDPMQTEHDEFDELTQHHLQRPLDQPLRQQQQPLQPPQPAGDQQAQEQQPLAALGQLPAEAAAPQSLYTFEQMAEENLPINVRLFNTTDPDPLGFGIGTSSLVADTLGYMGWPYSKSPDPFSPSAFLVTPTWLKVQCRSESNRGQVGAMHLGVHQ